jgi:hypothetical protein
MMDAAFLRAWVADVTGTLGRLLLEFEERFGYPPADNTISAPDDEAGLAEVEHLVVSLGMSRDLLDMYDVIGAVNLPDVGNGYFIHSPRLVVSTYSAAEPRAVSGSSYTGEVLIFASDGGGTLYALSAAIPASIYRLPPGEIHGGTYTGHHTGTPGAYTDVADDLKSFLNALRDTIEAFAATGTIRGL